MQELPPITRIIKYSTTDDDNTMSVVQETILNILEICNSPDRWEPFYVMLMFWITMFLYCYLPIHPPDKKVVFHQWTGLHNFFNSTVILMGLVSLYYNDDEIFSERMTCLWILSYFSVDLVDCVWRLDVAFTIHAVLCVLLGYINFTNPLCYALRINSKSAMFEISTPFMHYARSVKKPLPFLVFGILFFACRIAWIPVIGWGLLKNGLPPFGIMAIFSYAFYTLNLYWFYKIVRALIKGAKKAQKEEEEEEMVAEQEKEEEEKIAPPRLQQKAPSMRSFRARKSGRRRSIIEMIEDIPLDQLELDDATAAK